MFPLTWWTEFVCPGAIGTGAVRRAYQQVFSGLGKPDRTGCGQFIFSGPLAENRAAILPRPSDQFREVYAGIDPHQPGRAALLQFDDTDLNSLTARVLYYYQRHQREVFRSISA